MLLLKIEIKLDQRWILRKPDEYIKFFERRINGLSIFNLELIERKPDNSFFRMLDNAKYKKPPSWVLKSLHPEAEEVEEWKRKNKIKINL